MPAIYDKPALTFKQQLNQLQNRGLIVDDPKMALSQLKTISYYRLRDYWHPFRIRDAQGKILNEFEANTTFEDILKLYEFDRKLRLIVLDAIERIEVHARTILTYHLGHKYGAFAHTNAANFHSKFKHQEWITQIEKETYRSKEVFIVDYSKKYSEFPKLPIWMLTEVLSLGSLSQCYKGLLHDDKREISKHFSLPYKCLETWLHALTYIRNICAHHSRLWNRELAIRPQKLRDKKWSSIITLRNDRVFHILWILRFMLKTNCNGDDFAQQCIALLDSVIREERWQYAIGAPDNWETFLLNPHLQTLKS